MTNVGQFHHLVTPTSVLKIDSGEEVEGTERNGHLVVQASESPGGSPQWLYPSINQPGPVVRYNAAQTKQQHPGSPKLPSRPRPNEQGLEGSKLPEDFGRHCFKDCMAYGDSEQIQGTVGLVLESIPGHEFNNNRTHHNACMISGSVGSDVMDQLLRNRASRRNERDADGKAAGATS